MNNQKITPIKEFMAEAMLDFNIPNITPWMRRIKASWLPGV
ncbi:MAG: hypothetical protein R2688_06975 [Fimbriimonadaceae bacterium]